MNIRSQFPFFNHHQGLVYLDNAATSQKPIVVLRALEDWYLQYNANVHRGVYDLAEQATTMYEQARASIANHVGAYTHEIVFISGATASLNMLSYLWEPYVGAGDVILLTELEHHANIIPWQMVAQRKGACLRFIPVDGHGRLTLELLDELLDERVKVVSCTLSCHAIGISFDYRTIIEKAHAVGARMCVDAAQAIAHRKIDFHQLDVDAAVFSGHKVYGPLGIGALYLKEHMHQGVSPVFTGGGMVTAVNRDVTSFVPMPHILEAGTPHIVGAVGLATAMDWLCNDIGYEQLGVIEYEIACYAYDQLSRISKVTVYGERGHHIISFAVTGFHAHDVACYLNSQQIAVRAGTHCAHILAESLNLSSWVRISIAVYTNTNDIDRLVIALEKLMQ